MSLVGWTLPQTPTGRSSILPPPPWHYSGEIIAVDFFAEPEQVAALLPPGMEPAGDGSCSFVFADWCSAADGDPRIQQDPARGQYKEAYLILHGTYEGKRAGRVPYIWVDSDLSLVRGLVQGFPKKLGDIAMTRPVELGKGGVKKEAGGRFAAHVSSLGRRLCTAGVTIDGVKENYYPKGVSAPLLHTRLWPSIDGGPPAVYEYSRAKIAGFEVGKVFTGPATIEFGCSEHEEVDLLAPRSVEAGFVFSFAFSVVAGIATPIEG
jgi:acetoacetate decarboxylase